MNFLSNEIIISNEQNLLKLLQTELIRSHSGLKQFHHFPRRKIKPCIKTEIIELILGKPTEVKIVCVFFLCTMSCMTLK